MGQHITPPTRTPQACHPLSYVAPLVNTNHHPCLPVNCNSYWSTIFLQPIFMLKHKKINKCGSERIILGSTSLPKGKKRVLRHKVQKYTPAPHPSPVQPHVGLRTPLNLDILQISHL